MKKALAHIQEPGHRVAVEVLKVAQGHAEGANNTCRARSLDMMTAFKNATGGVTFDSDCHMFWGD